MKHYPVHLKLDSERDVTTYHLKHRKVHVLRSAMRSLKAYASKR